MFTFQDNNFCETVIAGIPYKKVVGLIGGDYWVALLPESQKEGLKKSCNIIGVSDIDKPSHEIIFYDHNRRDK